MLLCLTPQIEQTYVTPVLTNPSFSYRLLHPSVQWEKRTIDFISKLGFGLDEKAPQLHIQSIFYQIWMELYSHAPATQQSARPTLQLSCIKDMIALIQERYREKLTLNEIALAGSVCKSNCCSLFRRYLNRTPIDYLIQFRLQKSIELLSATDMNVTQLCFEVGFSGTSYYAETFHRYYGCSPTEYRLKHKEAAAGAH